MSDEPRDIELEDGSRICGTCGARYDEDYCPICEQGFGA